MNKYIVSIFCLALFAVVGVSTVQAAQKPVTGWAWSDTIGWVSFSSENDHDPNTNGTQPSPYDYGVSIDESSGMFSGYAWSSTIGWISFQKSDTTVCGTHAQLTDVPNPSGEIIGFARARSGNTSQAGGWTGCLELSDTNVHPSPDTTGDGGVTYIDNGTGMDQIDGWAWGAIPSTAGNGGTDPQGEKFDGIIGWLDFREVFVDLSFTEPSLNLQANPSVVYPLGPQPPQLNQWGTTKLTWNSNINTLTDCTAVDTGTPNQAGSDWLNGNTKDDPTGTQDNVEVPNKPTEYQIACTDTASGTKVKSNIAKVQRQWPEPTVSVTSGVACIADPGEVTISWDITYTTITDCVVTSGNLSPLQEYSGSETVTISNTETFSIMCPGNDDHDYEVSDDVTVEVGGSCEPADDPNDPATSEPGDTRPRFDEI